MTQVFRQCALWIDKAKDVMALTMTIVSNYGARRQCQRENCAHTSIAENVFTYDTFADSQDLSKYPNISHDHGIIPRTV
jgi:hypothetical protein